VSTAAGINGLDLRPGQDMVLANTAADMAVAIDRLFDRPEERKRIETAARATVEREFGWDGIARRQAALYSELTA
jgi:glycosyltransferase involved in cell wall biosynthesis